MYVKHSQFYQEFSLLAYSNIMSPWYYLSSIVCIDHYVCNNTRTKQLQNYEISNFEKQAKICMLTCRVSVGIVTGVV